MNFGCKSLMAIVNRTFKILFVAGALVFSTGVSSSIGLQVAWSNFMVEAKPMLDRGVKLQRVLKHALTSFEQSTVSLAATDIFIELLDALLTKVGQAAPLDAAECLNEFRTYLFDEMLSVSPLLRQKLALEVFKEYKKWNVVMTKTGLVGSVDRDVFMHFARSLPEFMSALTCEGKYLIPAESLQEFKKLGVELSKKFKTNLAVVLAKETANYTVHGYKVVAQKVKAMDAGTVRKVVMTTGAVSATALFLGVCYGINNHRILIRRFVESVGGPEKIKKEALLAYITPQSRLARFKRWLKDWLYNDAKHRAKRAEELKKLLSTAHKKDSVAQDATVQVHDPLTEVLLDIAKHPEKIPLEHALTFEREMVQSIHYMEYIADKKKHQSAQNRLLLKASKKANEALEKMCSDYKKALAPAWYVSVWNGMKKWNQDRNDKAADKAAANKAAANVGRSTPRQSSSFQRLYGIRSSKFQRASVNSEFVNDRQKHRASLAADTKRRQRALLAKERALDSNVPAVVPGIRALSFPLDWLLQLKKLTAIHAARRS